MSLMSGIETFVYLRISILIRHLQVNFKTICSWTGGLFDKVKGVTVIIYPYRQRDVWPTVLHNRLSRFDSLFFIT